ncbi:hypothetical protein SUGI_0775920 [Cryptomeria japonica]|uniref:E3 ubiquitin-protein ligase Os04g0590900 n=1 Tax=Cryptomeria japonica TaxID=3369 RepID=UPI0024147CC0|nr:E3 ubiquitin-protein ligase Os04g0590900 [Cryptomeria japonica]GLJ38117.1 hypothetical protein SUGI_0775920 [Cryptomeria japonica]
MSSDPRGSNDRFESSVWQPSTKPNSAFSPPAIGLVAVIAAAFLIVTYYRYFLKYCKPCLWTIPSRSRHDEVVVQDSDGLQLSGSQNFGLDEALLKKIPICRYRKGENLALMEGTECAVCLLEFEENECLRILPKCSHAFHINCIDMWLKTHANCPLCRSNVVGSDISITIPPPPAPSPVLEHSSVIIFINSVQEAPQAHYSTVAPQAHYSTVAEEQRDTVEEYNGLPEVKNTNMEKEPEENGANCTAMSSNLEAPGHESMQPLRREGLSGLENYNAFYGSLFTSNTTFRCHRQHLNDSLLV